MAAEVDRLIAATKGSRDEDRDRCLLVLMFRHGLRVSEACGLKLSQVDAENRVVHVLRLKQGLSTTQPLRPEEIRVIQAWLREAQGDEAADGCLFRQRAATALTSRKTVWLAVRKYGELAGLPLPVYPHMLRHACGYALADQGADTPAHSRLSRPPQHPEHRALHRLQPATV